MYAYVGCHWCDQHHQDDQGMKIQMHNLLKTNIILFRFTQMNMSELLYWL